MLILEDLKAELANYRPQLKELRDVLAVDSATEKISELQMMVEQPGFWDDVEKSQKTMQQIKGLENKTGMCYHLKKYILKRLNS